MNKLATPVFALVLALLTSGCLGSAIPAGQSNASASSVAPHVGGSWRVTKQCVVRCSVDCGFYVCEWNAATPPADGFDTLENAEAWVIEQAKDSDVAFGTNNAGWLPAYFADHVGASRVDCGFQEPDGTTTVFEITSL